MSTPFAGAVPTVKVSGSFSTSLPVSVMDIDVSSAVGAAPAVATGASFTTFTVTVKLCIETLFTALPSSAVIVNVAVPFASVNGWNDKERIEPLPPTVGSPVSCGLLEDTAT